MEALGFLLLSLIFFHLVGMFIVARIFAHKLWAYPQERVVHAEIHRQARGEIPPDWNELPWHHWELSLPRGIIRGRFLQGNTSKVVFFLHGSGTDHRSMIKYTPYFFEAGYSLVLWDWLGSGQSDSNYSTYGIWESKETLMIREFIQTQYPFLNAWGILGESMGASTGLLLAPQASWDFMILDCGFGNFETLMQYLKKKEFKILSRLDCFGLITKLIYFFFFQKVQVRLPTDQPQKAAMETQIPMLFVHGLDDMYVPPQHSRDLADRVRGFKKTYLVPKARHAQSWRQNPEGYYRSIKSFLEEKNELGN